MSHILYTVFGTQYQNPTLIFGIIKLDPAIENY